MWCIGFEKQDQGVTILGGWFLVYRAGFVINLLTDLLGLWLLFISAASFHALRG